MDQYKKSKKGDGGLRQIGLIWRIRVLDLLEKKFDCCSQKIQYFIEEEYIVKIAISKIYHLLDNRVLEVK